MRHFMQLLSYKPRRTAGDITLVGMRCSDNLGQLHVSAAALMLQVMPAYKRESQADKQQLLAISAGPVLPAQCQQRRGNVNTTGTH